MTCSEKLSPDPWSVLLISSAGSDQVSRHQLFTDAVAYRQKLLGSCHDACYVIKVDDPELRKLVLRDQQRYQTIERNAGWIIRDNLSGAVMTKAPAATEVDLTGQLAWRRRLDALI